MLRLRHEPDRIDVHFGQQRLLSYVYLPSDAQLESPRPYFHPVHTLGGALVTGFRPADHVWHKGISLALPNVGAANFWGGVTWLRGQGYVQLPNNGAQLHDEFLRVDDDTVAHRLSWVTEPGEVWFRELRRFSVSVLPTAQAWVLTFATALTNISGHTLLIDSPTTLGREMAGYGGLFWRGPASFEDGTIHGSDMGSRAPWLGYAKPDATLVFVDAPDNDGHPTEWFVRSTPFACAGPAPFFSTPRTVADGESLLLRYAIVIADGDTGAAGCADLAKHGLAALSTWDEV